MLDFDSFNEAVYVGNIGVMELMKFYKIATSDQKKKLESSIKNKNSKAAWELVQKVTGVKLHKSVSESKNIKSDILPVSGAGQWGTDTLKNKYIKDTPGQGFKLYKKHKI